MADGCAPVALALVVCDAIQIDPATGKRTLSGLFTTVTAETFPAAVPVSVYACLTECRRAVPFTLRIVDAGELRPPLFDASNRIGTVDPLGVAELVIRIPLLLFPAAGEYAVQLLSDGTPLAERRLIVSAVGRTASA